MPYGVSMGEFLRFSTAALLATAAGCQVVHNIYQPLDGIEDAVKEREKQLLLVSLNNEDKDSKTAEAPNDT